MTKEQLRTYTKVFGVDEQLADFLLTIVIPIYKSNDSAHGVEHLEEVFSTAITILERVGYKTIPVEDRASAFVAILFHDITATTDRDNHQNSGAEAFDRMMNTVVRQSRNRSVRDAVIAGRYNIDINKAKAAIREHRASYKGEFTSIASEIVSGADRGIPQPTEENVKHKIDKSYKYHIEKLSEDETLARINSLKHIKEKYGAKGYAKYPNIYEKAFKHELEAFKRLVDSICSAGVEKCSL